MNQPDRDPGRRSLPHHPPVEQANQSILIYVSAVVKRRRPLLANQQIVGHIQTSWRKADHWLVGRWVIMPEHIHLFCAPVKFPMTSLKRWMEYWQADATREWPVSVEKPIWQKDFFDRQLRNGDSYHQKWLYLWENPIKEGLVKRPEDWPYQGEMNVLPWHEVV